jgi:hypothetical protein
MTSLLSFNGLLGGEGKSVSPIPDIATSPLVRTSSKHHLNIESTSVRGIAISDPQYLGICMIHRRCDIELCGDPQFRLASLRFITGSRAPERLVIPAKHLS